MVKHYKMFVILFIWNKKILNKKYGYSTKCWNLQKRWKYVSLELLSFLYTYNVVTQRMADIQTIVMDKLVDNWMDKVTQQNGFTICLQNHLIKLHACFCKTI